MNPVVSNVIQRCQPRAELVLHAEAPPRVVGNLRVGRLESDGLAEKGLQSQTASGWLGKSGWKWILERADEGKAVVSASIQTCCGTVP